MGPGLTITLIIVVILFVVVVALASRYRRCPSDKILVVYGSVGNSKDGSTRSAHCIHGGARLVWPVIQDYK